MGVRQMVNSYQKRMKNQPTITTAIATTESTTPSKQTQISPNQSFSTAAAVSPVKSKTIQALLANFDQNKDQEEAAAAVSPVKSKTIKALLANFEAKEIDQEKDQEETENMENVRAIGRPIIVYDSSSSSDEADDASSSTVQKPRLLPQKKKPSEKKAPV